MIRWSAKHREHLRYKLARNTILEFDALDTLSSFYHLVIYRDVRSQGVPLATANVQRRELVFHAERARNVSAARYVAQMGMPGKANVVEPFKERVF